MFIVECVASCKLHCYTEEIKRIGDQSSLTAETCSGHYREQVTMVVSARHC